MINTISDDRLYEIVDKLALLLESYSAAMFGSKHFIISMIFNLFYMGSTNHELSTSYEYDIGLSKRMLVWIFSDVIYTLEKYRQTYSKMIITINDDIEIENAFTILHKRVIELCMFFQQSDFETGKYRGYGDNFDLFCINNEIHKAQGEYFIRDNNKRYKFKKIASKIDPDIVANELHISTSIVIPVICRLNQ